jgi:hypothetical protein
MTISKPIKQDFVTRFKYVLWDDLFLKEKPFEITIPIPPGAPDQRRTNLTFEYADEEIVHDIGEPSSDYKLDVHGFTYLKHQSQLRADQFDDAEKINQIYIPECEELLKRYVDDVDQVYVYNWRLRKTEDRGRQGTMVNFEDPLFALGAAVHVHIDQSPSTVVERIGFSLPDQADFLLRGRVQHINIWRPLNGPIEDYPLAVCDGRTVPVSNTLETDRISRRYQGDTLFTTFQKGYEWYFLNGQKNDEPVLFKSFDSKEDVTGYAPHVSFPVPSTEKLRGRESIEARCLVFTYPREGSETQVPTNGSGDI